MQIKNKKILVTGGAGFIGSHIVNSLLQKGANVVVYDDFSSGNLENLSHIKNEIKIIRGNILEFDKLKQAVKGIDIISHQAAHLEILQCVKNPIEDLTNNTIGSLNILRSCLRNNVSKIIIASSACVYGQAQYTPEDEKKHPTKPNWEYGVSKLAVEKYSNIFAQRYGMDITNLRYSIVYGPREWYGRVLTLFLKRAMENKSLIVFGNGRQERDFIYVDDIVRLHNICMEKDIRGANIFNASTGKATTVSQLAELIKNTINPDIDIIYEDVKEGEISHYFNRVRLVSELKSMVLDNKKAKRLLRWEPKTDLKDGIKKEYKWLLANKHRWKKMSV